MPDQKPTAAPASFPNVDRLMELGSSKDNKGTANPKEPREKSMWKLLLQLRPLLPYLARLVPMLEMAVGPLQSAGMSSDVRKAVAESIADSTAKIESMQRDLGAAVASALDQQTLQLKSLEDQVSRLDHAAERLSAAQASLADDLKSVKRLLQIAVLGGAMLLMALIVMSGVLLARLSH